MGGKLDGTEGGRWRRLARPGVAAGGVANEEHADRRSKAAGQRRTRQDPDSDGPGMTRGKAAGQRRTRHDARQSRRTATGSTWRQAWQAAGDGPDRAGQPEKKRTLSHGPRRWENPPLGSEGRAPAPSHPRNQSQPGQAPAQDGQSRPDRTRPDQTGPDQSGPDRTRADRTGPDRTGPDQTGPDQTGTGPDRTGPDRTGPDRTGPDQTRPGQSGPDRTRPDRTRPDQTGPDQSGPDQSGPDQSGPDRTRPDRPAHAQPAQPPGASACGRRWAALPRIIFAAKRK